MEKENIDEVNKKIFEIINNSKLTYSEKIEQLEDCIISCNYENMSVDNMLDIISEANDDLDINNESLKKILKQKAYRNNK